MFPNIVRFSNLFSLHFDADCLLCYEALTVEIFITRRYFSRYLLIVEQ